MWAVCLRIISLLQMSRWRQIFQLSVGFGLTRPLTKGNPRFAQATRWRVAHRSTAWLGYRQRAGKKPENVIPRLKKMLGPDVKFELEWVSIYTFQCRRMERFVHERVIFAGDSAHQVSPFGARGANSGIQDVDNLCWKLAAVIDGTAKKELLETYNDERLYAADENISNSTRSTDFITPKSQTSRVFRDAVLTLAERHEFARPLVNSGRLSMPSTYPIDGCDYVLMPQKSHAQVPQHPMHF